mmetsp:Transcript_8080/g.23230  ORF Transcript_8080/g.23230 Transcript_8080/m.23230 type:complete len:351 (+) Transcript_8080:95-1147(+)
MANRNDIEAAIAAETKLANKTIDNKNSNNVNTNNNHSTDANAARMEPMIPTSVAPLVAGLAGGSLSTALLLPLDNIKVRLQVREKSQQQQQRKPASSTTKPSRPSSSSLSPSRAGAYRMLRGIIRHEGVAGLYQGMVPAVLGSSISWGGYFFLYEGFKDRLRRYKAAAQEQSRHDDTHTTIAASDIVLSSFENFQLACSAGAVMVFFTNPIWLIKLRLQLQMKQASQGLLTKKPYSGMLDAARTIVREEGIFALYKGTGPALMLTSHGGVQFVVYEYLRKNFHISRPSRKRVSDDAYQPVLERLEKSLGYLAMGATAKMCVVGRTSIGANLTLWPIDPSIKLCLILWNSR